MEKGLKDLKPQMKTTLELMMLYIFSPKKIIEFIFIKLNTEKKNLYIKY